FKQRGEGVLRGNAARRGFGFSGFSRGGEWRDFGSGETDFGGVLKSESAAVDNTARRPARDGIAAARKRTHGLLRRRSAETSEHDCQMGRNGRGQAPVPPADHRRQWKGGNAATVRRLRQGCGVVSSGAFAV